MPANRNCKDPVQTQINDQCNMKLKVLDGLNSRKIKGESVAKQTVQHLNSQRRAATTTNCTK